MVEGPLVLPGAKLGRRETSVLPAFFLLVAAAAVEEGAAAAAAAAAAEKEEEESLFVVVTCAAAFDGFPMAGLRWRRGAMPCDSLALRLVRSHRLFDEVLSRKSRLSAGRT